MTVWSSLWNTSRVAAFLLIPSPGWASAAVVEACLDAVDIACAERVLSGYNLETTRDPQVL